MMLFLFVFGPVKNSKFQKNKKKTQQNNNKNDKQTTKGQQLKAPTMCY
jgi:hypothetical protein